MVSRFHLAIPAGDLDKAINFYCEILGCARGNSEFKYPDAWADINFWGNELTLHATEPNEKNISERHNVDMGNVTVPHFGVHLDADTFEKLKLDELLTMNRKTGFYEMIEIMIRKLKNVEN